MDPIQGMLVYGFMAITILSIVGAIVYAIIYGYR
jgi:hypothetical protein